jgi:hypothetical protein
LIAMKAKWVVRLGRSEWTRHTQGGNVGESLRLLGSVQRGAHVGALAVDSNGDYFQVNGEYVAPLNKRFMAKAVSVARSHVPSRHEAVRQRTAPPPVVTVRRSRVAVSALRRGPGTPGGH